MTVAEIILLSTCCTGSLSGFFVWNGWPLDRVVAKITFLTLELFLTSANITRNMAVGIVSAFSNAESVMFTIQMIAVLIFVNLLVEPVSLPPNFV